MMESQSPPRSTRRWRLRRFFEATEVHAANVRKDLARLQTEAAVNVGSVTDAIKLARYVESLARHGHKLKAAEADRLFCRLEPLVARLAEEVDALLAATIRRV